MEKNNLTRYEKDLERLIAEGRNIFNAMRFEQDPEAFTKVVVEARGKEADAYIKALPQPTTAYQTWYSESLVLIKQLLASREEDFVSLYRKPKARKEITYENYMMEDYLQGLQITRGYEKAVVVDRSAAIPRMQQQLAIVQSVKVRFASSLFDIRTLLQADVFDGELEAAEELQKHKFYRAAGALAGVVLERHLAEVCKNHQQTIIKKNPSIADYNDSLKEAGILDLPAWRFIQHLADIRNICDHVKTGDPTSEQTSDLISGVKKTIKTVM